MAPHSTNLGKSPAREIQRLISRAWGPTPLPFKVAIFSDFDGTISNLDTLKFILNEHGRPEWKNIENGMASGALAEREGLQKAFDYLSLSFPKAKEEILENISLDPAFKDFADWIQFEGHSLQILSGGFKKLIKPLLDREGLESLEVIANDVQVSDKSWKVLPCKMERLCSECNHCKSASLFEQLKKDPHTFIVYIGDGHTDTCPVQLADLVFAKGFLKDYCSRQGMDYVPFQSFADVEVELRWRLRSLNRQWLRMTNLQQQKEVLSRRKFSQTEANFYEFLLQRFTERQQEAIEIRRERLVKRCERKLGWSAQQFLKRAAQAA
jgi:2-hydroxy-3-keto-5-methylthiopentenyl-1-phosphate phosphatase